MTQFEKLGEHLGCCEQILEYLSKVNKATFASDIFRVFFVQFTQKIKLTSLTKKSLFRLPIFYFYIG